MESNQSVIKVEPHDVDSSFDEYVPTKRKQITQLGDEELDSMAALLTPEVTLKEDPPGAVQTVQPCHSSSTERRQPVSFQFVAIKEEPTHRSSGSEDDCPVSSDPFRGLGQEMGVDKQDLTIRYGEVSLPHITGSPSHRVFSTQDAENPVGEAYFGNRSPGDETMGWNTDELGHAAQPKNPRLVRRASKSYACDLCSKLFNRKDTLVTHYRTHTGEKPFHCDVCGRHFSVLSSLTSHKRTHTGEKPYQCKICLKEFNRSSSLSTHSRTHTGAKPYQCKVCRKQFSHASSFTTHSRTHTGDKPYQCQVCRKQFSDSSNLISHNRTHASDKLFIARFPK